MYIEVSDCFGLYGVRANFVSDWFSELYIVSFEMGMGENLWKRLDYFSVDCGFFIVIASNFIKYK